MKIYNIRYPVLNAVASAIWSTDITEVDCSF